MAVARCPLPSTKQVVRCHVHSANKREGTILCVCHQVVAEPGIVWLRPRNDGKAETSDDQERLSSIRGSVS